MAIVRRFHFVDRYHYYFYNSSLNNPLTIFSGRTDVNPSYLLLCLLLPFLNLQFSIFNFQPSILIDLRLLFQDGRSKSYYERLTKNSEHEITEI